MPHRRWLAGLPILIASALPLQGCRGTSSLQPVSPPAASRPSSTQAPLVPAPPAVLHFHRVPFQLPAAVQREVGVADGADMYLAGGLNQSGTSVAAVVRVDPSGGVATVVGQLPQRFHDGAGAVIGNRLFVFGGGPSTGSDVVQSFAPAGDIVKVEGSLPRALSDLSAAKLDAVTYLVGGYDGISPQRAIFATSDGRHFRRVGALPVGLRYPAVAAGDGMVVIVGGVTTQGSSDSVLAFDPSSGKVRTIGHLPLPLGHAAAFTANGVVYVAGGTDGSGLTVRTIFALDLATGHIAFAGKLPAPISDAAVVVFNDQAWLFGGQRGAPVSEILAASTTRP